MNTSHGWIKLYRTLLGNPLWLASTAEQKVILVTLLLMANHAERKWEWQGKPYTCRPGQMITSLQSIQGNCGKGISLRQIQLALMRFEKMGFLVKQTTRSNTLITICHWAAYQDIENPDVKADGKPMLDPCQTDVKHALYNKNDKNGKKEKKGKPLSSFRLSFEQQDLQRAAQANTDAMTAFMED